MSNLPWKTEYKAWSSGVYNQDPRKTLSKFDSAPLTQIWLCAFNSKPFAVTAFTQLLPFCPYGDDSPPIPANTGAPTDRTRFLWFQGSSCNDILGVWKRSRCNCLCPSNLYYILAPSWTFPSVSLFRALSHRLGPTSLLPPGLPPLNPLSISISIYIYSKK